MRILLCTSIFFCCINKIVAQSTIIDSASFTITVQNDKHIPATGAIVEIFSQKNILIKSAIAGDKAIIVFSNLPPGQYFFKISSAGYETQITPVYHFPVTKNATINLQAGTTLQTVSVVARKPFIQHTQGKIIVNPDASITNTGTSVLEVLEKSPGILVDKNGTISMQGKTGVLIMIDDKPTYLSGTDLSNLLGGMSSTQVEQIELITNPSAKYDASGNAGIINIKTKKNKQKGFNGSLTTSYGQGRYPKSNNSLVLNYRNGKVNVFFTYSMAYNKYYMDLYALRRYFDVSGNVTGKLDQPSLFDGDVFNNVIKTGLDFYASANTTLGITLSGINSKRKGDNQSFANWINASGGLDSSILTASSSSNNSFKNAAINLNGKHDFSKTKALSANVDWLTYDINSYQYFNSKLLTNNGYDKSSQGNIPATIHIFSAKADYAQQFANDLRWEAGWKSSHIATDNLADYELYNGNAWAPDYAKSNHFLYKENIHALYSSVEKKYNRFTIQAGLRYEYTAYDAHQLGNVQRGDSSFSRTYSGLFPSGYITYQMDSSNSFTLTAGRRIDRPAFQKLNPFVFIINKYTYQRGNPYFLPQYTWNMQLSHQYKQLLTTTISYSIIKNYFSQLFLNEGNDILTYTEGNVGKMSNLAASIDVQLAPVKYWSFTGEVLFNYKKLNGYLGNDYSSTIHQFNFSLNNQFKLGKLYTAELSGAYTTRARNDIQELLYPTGQMSFGVSRPVLKKKGTLKFGLRDIFHSQTMEGLTQFPKADEYFIIHRDSRTINIALIYRFGKAFKLSKRNNGGANDEMQRVGSGS